MRKFVLWHALPLLLILTACPVEKASALETKVEVTQGIRHDHLRWRASRKHEGVHAQTKADLHSKRIYLSGLKGTICAGDYVGCLDLVYGDVFHGKARERIRSEEGPKQEIAHMHAKIHGDYNFDSSLKIGRIFHVYQDATLTPSLGAAYFLQKYTLKKGDVTIRGEHPNYPGAPQFLDTHRKFHDMHATTKASWASPFIDLRLKKPVFSSFALEFGYAFFYPMHFTNKSHFEHVHSRIKDKSRERNTYGQQGDVTLHYSCIKNLEIALGARFSEFIGHDGYSRVSEHGSTEERFRFKKVRRTTVDYLLSLAYSF